MTRYIPFTKRFGSFAPEHARESDPSFTLEAHIASLRDTDPKLWAQLNADWNNPNFKGDGQDV